MKYLLYCIFQTSGDSMPEILFGVDNQLISLLIKNGLCAVISRIANLDLSADNSAVLAYERIIESFHRQRAVIPMRYGCVFEEEARIAELLEERHQYYQGLLEELKDNVEMGIRVLFENRRHTMPDALLSPAPVSPAASASFSLVVSGVAYLAAQRDRYAAEDQELVEHNKVLETICSSLSVLFVRSKKELSLYAGRRLLSIYFLVPRNSVEVFREAFHNICLNSSAKLLLSGPWPPYNYVRSDNLGRTSLYV